MKVVIDIEANALINPTQIWVIVCKDIDTGEINIFRNLTTNDTERLRFLEYSRSVNLWVGHNLLGWDAAVLLRLVGLNIREKVLDTLILSKLIDYPRSGKHSIENYGEEFGIKKGDFHLWGDKDLFNSSSTLFRNLEEYCIRDVEICHKVYLKYLKYILKEEHKPSIDLEHRFQGIINTLEYNGFSFNTKKALGLLHKVTEELKKLDEEILRSFPPRTVTVREFTPTATKFGTISKTSVPRSLHEKIDEYEIGKTYTLTKEVIFNPSSHKQLIEVLTEAGWKPTDKTKTHIDTERELQRQKYNSRGANPVDLAAMSAKLKILEKTGWQINETNLSTLPSSAPAPARTLAKRILLESRRRTLSEWIGLTSEDGRIHGKFYGIGAWTHRMAHQKPNTANIPNELDTQGNVKLLGKEMRTLWCAPKNRLLVGVDAEGIQLRIFAHLIDDKEFTDALVTGKKSDKTDPHSLNQRILGSVCKSRQAAKRFIYALLLGAGLPKLSAILECSDEETKEALERLLGRYEGWKTLKEERFPQDASRGYLIGLDGRKLRIPGETVSNRKHLCMSGYLQAGEAIVMKAATIKWMKEIEDDKDLIASGEIKLVNFVHDEWQTETPNNMEVAVRVAELQCKALEQVGLELGLKCPLAGSYWNDDHHDYTIGTNWYQTH